MSSGRIVILNQQILTVWREVNCADAARFTTVDLLQIATVTIYKVDILSVYGLRIYTSESNLHAIW